MLVQDRLDVTLQRDRLLLRELRCIQGIFGFNRMRFAERVLAIACASSETAEISTVWKRAFPLQMSGGHEGCRSGDGITTSDGSRIDEGRIQA